MSMNRQNNTSPPCSTSTPTQNQYSNQTSENQDDNQWPRFLIMEAADKNIPLNLNAFVLKKAIDGMANADLDNVKPMKSGSIFIKVETKQQCKNRLKTIKLLGYLPVKVSPHRTLNSSKFVIKCEELDTMEEDEIKKEFQPQGIIAVKRISIRYSLYVLTIKGQTIPKRINIGYLKKEMENWERHCDPQIYRKDFIRRCSQTFTTFFRPIKGFICNCNTDPSSIFKTSSTLGQKNPTSNWL